MSYRRHDAEAGFYHGHDDADGDENADSSAGAGVPPGCAVTDCPTEPAVPGRTDAG
jgi:hypothetical protein